MQWEAAGAGRSQHFARTSVTQLCKVVSVSVVVPDLGGDGGLLRNVFITELIRGGDGGAEWKCGTVSKLSSAKGGVVNQQLRKCG